MAIYSYLTEAKSDRSAIESQSINGYSHLMKCVYTNTVNGSWAKTILTCNEALYESSIVDIRRIMDDNIAMERIRRKAINKYHRDGNKDGERMFEETLNLFPSLMDLRDPYKVTNYLIAIANQCGDDNVINKCKKHLSDLKL